jgi:hypothetical protein
VLSEFKENETGTVLLSASLVRDTVTPDKEMALLKSTFMVCPIGKSTAPLAGKLLSAIGPVVAVGVLDPPPEPPPHPAMIKNIKTSV